MSSPHLFMWLIVFAVGIPASFRNATALALVLSWFAGEAAWLLTGNRLPLSTYFMADVAVIALVYAKTIKRVGAKQYPTLRRQLYCLIGDLTPFDRWVVAIFTLGMWPAYVLAIEPYFKWWLLWALAIAQFVAAGMEVLLGFLKSRSVARGKAQRLCRPPSGRDGLIKISIPAQVPCLAHGLNVSAPALIFTVPSYARLACLIPAISLRISHVGVVRNITKIADAVVRWVAVNVIYFTRRPLPEVDSPCNAMRAAIPASNSGLEIPSGRFGCERFMASPSGIPRAHSSLAAKELCGTGQPKQLAGLRFITEKLTERFRGRYFSGSHGADPSRSGQGRAMSQASFRPAFSTTKLPKNQRAAERELATANGGGGYG